MPWQPVDAGEQSVTVAETGPSVTIALVDGNNSSTPRKPLPVWR